MTAQRMMAVLVVLRLSLPALAAERRVRQPGVEEAAKIILVTPKYLRVLLSAELCIAQDRALGDLVGGEGGGAAEVARLMRSLATNGTPEAIPCADREVGYLRTCLGVKPPVWCEHRWRTDAYVRAAEIEADGGPEIPLDPKRLREYREYEKRLAKDVASGATKHVR